MGIALMSSSHIIQKQLLAMLALNKSTAAKLLVLWNLPVLLLLAGAFEVGSKVWFKLIIIFYFYDLLF